jgi:hypothetical protein
LALVAARKVPTWRLWRLVDQGAGLMRIGWHVAVACRGVS